MSTNALSKAPSAGAILLTLLIGKFDARRYLPKLANGFVRFNSAGDLVADSNPLPALYKDAAYTAKSGERIAANTTAAAFAVTLPAAPAAGDVVEIYDAADTFQTNNLTLGRNGLKIDSASANLVLSGQGIDVTLVYINATIGWKTFYRSSFVKNGLTASGSVTNDFSGSTGAFKTSTGLNTVGGKQALKVVAAAVAATGAGGGVAGAAALGSANIVRVSSDGATKGVKLLTGVPGDLIEVINTSGTACNLFAAAGGTINGGAANAGCTIPASKGVRCFCTAADTWTVFDMPALAGAAA